MATAPKLKRAPIKGKTAETKASPAAANTAEKLNAVLAKAEDAIAAASSAEPEVAQVSGMTQEELAKKDFNLPQEVVVAALIEMQHQVSVYHQALTVLNSSGVDLGLALIRTEHLHAGITDKLDELVKGLTHA